jgi:SPP1 gp7 family putative phage head morphogenesis protein
MNWVKSLIDYVVWKYFGYEDLEFRWDEEQDTDPKTQMDVLTGYVAAKIVTVDEAREELGRDPLTPEQDEKLNPPAPPPMPGMPGPGGEPAVGGTGKPVGKLRGAPLRKVASRNRASVKRSVAQLTKVVTSALEKVAKRAAKLTLPQEAAYKAGVTADEKARKLISELTFEELQDIAPELAEILTEMAADGGKVALAELVAEVTNDQLKQVNDRAVDYARERSAKLVKGLEDSTRDMLRETVGDALEEGLSNKQLADALAEEYAFSAERAETIANTETAYADVQGNLEGYKASGVVEGKQWIIAQDEFCDDCNNLDGVIVGLDEEFPGDGGDGPPLHPNCRCDILPVLIEEDNV